MARQQGRLGILITLVAVGLPAGWARPARACINGVVEKTDNRVPLVTAAERDLARGAPRAALKRLEGGPHVACSHPGIPKACALVDGKRWDPALRRRWALATAVATLRIDPDAAERVAQHLLYLQELYVESPYIQARLAEALAHVTGSEPRALALLADLEQRDVMPDAGGYALLARLRRARGDAPGSERALARCRKIAGKPDACSAT
jgi:predicted Zn-dependent protease